MKKRNMVILTAAFMLFGMTAGAQETEGETQAAASVDSGVDSSTAVLSDDWKDYQIQLNDQVIQLPLMYSDFEALGWVAEDVADVMLDPYSYDFFSCEKDGYECTAYILNLGINTLPASECIVGGISVENYDWEVGSGTVVLPGGLVRGEADGAAIEAAYGTPSDTYEGDLYKKYSYETDYDCSIDLFVYNESGVLEDIEMRNFVEPEDFDPGEVSAEIPEAVALYEKPEAFSGDPAAYEIQIEENVYALPVPVSVLVADGWEIDASETEPEIAAGYFGRVTLRKGGLELRGTVSNPESFAVLPENGWIEELEAGVHSLDVDGALPFGVKIGTTEEELLAALETAGLSYEVEQSSEDYAYYIINEQDYGHCFEVTVYKSDDGYQEKDTIINILCENQFE